MTRYSDILSRRLEDPSTKLSSHPVHQTTFRPNNYLRLTQTIWFQTIRLPDLLHRKASTHMFRFKVVRSGFCWRKRKSTETNRAHASKSTVRFAEMLTCTAECVIVRR